MDHGQRQRLAAPVRASRADRRRRVLLCRHRGTCRARPRRRRLGLHRPLAGEDYLETSGGLTFPVGATARTIPVPILADDEDEPDETFLVELSNLSAAGDPVLLDPLGIGTIRNDDFCARSHGYWKNH
ncbi:MAG: hypothetical protein GY835_16620, partial [bacterium]|nr:hypothetical protein [bacterium]